jgi:hypothetical protein
MIESVLPVWEGQPLAGKTLIVWGQHDEVLQSLRWVPSLAEQVHRAGGRLLLWVPQRLLTLVRRSLRGVPVRVPPAHAPLPVCDYGLPLVRLPLGGHSADPPARTAILQPDPIKVVAWSRHDLGCALRVGLVWRGRERTDQDPHGVPCAIETAPLAAALGGIAGVTFLSLLREVPGEVAQLQAAGLPLLDHTGQLASDDDLAAYIKNLDLVIALSSGAALMAAGLGVPTWLLHSRACRSWMRGTPAHWAPAMRLYRQGLEPAWADVLARVRADLLRLEWRPGSLDHQRRSLP